MRVRVRDDCEWRGHNFILSHGSAQCVLTRKCACGTFPEVYSVYSFLTCLQFSSGRHHRCVVTGLSKGIQFTRAWILFTQHVHWCSGIFHEFSLLYLFRRGCRHYRKLPVGESNGGLVPCFDLQNISRQVPWFSVGASFLLQRFLYVLFSNFGAHGLRSWGSHFCIIPCDGHFLSRIFMWCNVPLENLTVWFYPNLPTLRRIDLFRR